MSVLVIVDRSPYGSWSGRESMDMALSLAAFDQPVTLLFSGVGVNWLRAGQDPASIFQKAVERNLAAAPIFGIGALLADQQSLEDFGLDASQCVSGVTPVTVEPTLLARFDDVVCL